MDYLPASLKNLHLFVPAFNLSLDYLPGSLTKLNLVTYSGNIDYLPTSLQRLDIENEFDSPVDYLPESLLYLRLGCSFDHPVDNLPQHLQLLTMGISFNQPVDNLPSSLASFYILEKMNYWKSTFSAQVEERASDSEYDFCQFVDHLPSSLSNLILGDDFNLPIDNLPPNLQQLRVGRGFGQLIDYLPPNLNTLILGATFNEPIEFLPHSLKSIVLEGDDPYEQSLATLPPNITHFGTDVEHLLSVSGFDWHLPKMEVLRVNTTTDDPDAVVMMRKWWKSVMKFHFDKIPQLRELIVISAHFSGFSQQFSRFELPSGCIIKVKSPYLQDFSWIWTGTEEICVYY